MLRRALFFETRRERFVDYGGFGDDPDGAKGHRGYMRLILEAIRERTAAGDRDDEDAAVVGWLEVHAPEPLLIPEPADSDPRWLEFEDSLDDGHVAAAVALAARARPLDLKSGQEVDEDRMRARLSLALRHLAPATVEAERAVTVEGFQGVGPVDVVLRNAAGERSGLIECKWSRDLKRDKIFEGAWDAIKLVLADAGAARRWLEPARPESSWLTTETADLFADGTIDTVELWVGRPHPVRTASPPSDLTASPEVAAICSRTHPSGFG